MNAGTGSRITERPRSRELRGTKAAGDAMTAPRSALSKQRPCDDGLNGRAPARWERQTRLRTRNQLPTKVAVPVASATGRKWHAHFRIIQLDREHDTPIGVLKVRRMPAPAPAPTSVMRCMARAPKAGDARSERAPIWMIGLHGPRRAAAMENARQSI